MRGGDAKELKQNDQKERNVVETLNQGHIKGLARLVLLS